MLVEEAVLAVGAAMLMMMAARALIPRDAVLRLLGGLAVLELASVALAPNGWLAIRSAGLLLAGGAVFLVARSIPGAERGVDALAWLMAPLALVAGSVLLEAWGVLPGWSNAGHAPGGLMGERNLAAEFVLIGVPVLVTVALQSERRWVRVAAVILCGVSACAAVVGRSRGVWVAGMGLAVLGGGLALRSVDRKRAVAIGAAVVVGAVAAPWLGMQLAWSSPHPYFDTLAHLVDAASPSGSGRLVQFETTVRMWLAHPLLGVGPGNWAGQYPGFAAEGDSTLAMGFWPTNRVPNSDLLGFLAERGAPSFLVLVCVAVLLWRSGGTLARVTLLTVVALGAVDAVLQLPGPLMLAAWVLGVSTKSAPEKPLPVAWVGLALALSVSAVFAVGRVASLRQVVRAESMEALERAAELDPGDVALRLSLVEGWIARGHCDLAAPHLAAVHRWTPAGQAGIALAAQCQ